MLIWCIVFNDFEEVGMTWWMWLLAIGFVLVGINKGAEENKRKEAEKAAAKEADESPRVC